MAFTGRLGTEDSRPGNILLGSTGAPGPISRSAADSINLAEAVTRIGTFIRGSSDAVALSDVAVAVKNPTVGGGANQAVWID